MAKSAGHDWSISQAKEFLVSKIAKEAEIEGVPFSTIERRMLYWSEELAPADQDTGLGVEFEDHYDRPEYEAKVSKLVRAAYKQDRRDSAGEVASWWAAIRALDREDHYISVMIKQAGLKPPGDTWHLWSTACGIVAAFLVLIFLALHFGMSEKETDALPWLFMGSLVTAWIVSSPKKRKIARSMTVGIAEGLLVIPRVIVTSAAFWARVGLRRIGKRSRKSD